MSPSILTTKLVEYKYWRHQEKRKT